MSSLLQRILTALALIPLVVWVVLFSPDVFFSVFLSVIIFITAYEWAGLGKIVTRVKKYFFASLVLLLAHGASFLDQSVLHGLMFISLVFWFLAILFIIIKPNRLLTLKLNQTPMLLLGLFVIGFTFVSINLLRQDFQQSPELLMYLLLLIWVADSGAYFAGRSFGKHKLSPLISPGKSIEGVIGGLLACFAFSFYGSSYLDVSNQTVFIILSVFIAFVSVFGDLFESLIKRRANVKDSGSILPGHGGMLDRIDSLIATGPVFLAMIYLTEVFV